MIENFFGIVQHADPDTPERGAAGGREGLAQLAAEAIGDHGIGIDPEEDLAPAGDPAQSRVACIAKPVSQRGSHAPEQREECAEGGIERCIEEGTNILESKQMVGVVNLHVSSVDSRRGLRLRGG